MKLIFIVLFVASTVASGFAQADVFMMRDKTGKIYFTDEIPSENKRQNVLKEYTAPGKHKARSLRYGRMKFNDRYDAVIRSASVVHGVDANLIKSVIKVESDFNRLSVSSKGARGLMQLMPETARDMKVKNVFDARENIMGGSKYLKKMLTQFRGDTRLALAAYNAGPTAVRKYNGVPPFKETQRYVKKVFAAQKALTGSRYVVRYNGFKAKTKAQNKKADYYTYRSSNGSRVYTDTPGRQKRIFRY